MPLTRRTSDCKTHTYTGTHTRSTSRTSSRAVLRWREKRIWSNSGQKVCRTRQRQEKARERERKRRRSCCWPRIREIARTLQEQRHKKICPGQARKERAGRVGDKCEWRMSQISQSGELKVMERLCHWKPVWMKYCSFSSFFSSSFSPSLRVSFVSVQKATGKWSN